MILAGIFEVNLGLELAKWNKTLYNTQSSVRVGR